MFESDTNIGLLNTARANQSAAHRNARQADLNLEAMEEWKAYAQKLEAQLAELKKVREADGEALAAVTAAWRKEHPVSHMHDVVGKFKDGGDMRRNVAIRVTAFDAAAKRLGIRIPEAWRIS